MKAKADAPKKIKILINWLDEAIILGIVLLAVISADAFKKALSGLPVRWEDFLIGWPNFIISSLVAITVYGSMYVRPYSEKEKAPFVKRAAQAIIQGFAWRLLFSKS